MLRWGEGMSWTEIFNQTQVQSGESQTYYLNTPNGCSLVVYNQSPYNVIVQTQNGQTVDVVPGHHSVTMPYEGWQSLVFQLDPSVSDGINFSTEYVAIRLVSGTVTYSRQALYPSQTTLASAIEAAVQGLVQAEITNSSLPVTNASGESLQVAGSVEISGSPSVSISGAPSVNVANTPTVTVGNSALNVTTAPGDTVTVAGTVEITGTPSVNISGTPTVAIANGQSIEISGTPNVNVANTPTVEISGTPNVNIANTPSVQIESGSVSATIENASINTQVVNTSVPTTDLSFFGTTIWNVPISSGNVTSTVTVSCTDAANALFDTNQFYLEIYSPLGFTLNSVQGVLADGLSTVSATPQTPWTTITPGPASSTWYSLTIGPMRLPIKSFNLSITAPGSTQSSLSYVQVTIYASQGTYEFDYDAEQQGYKPMSPWAANQQMLISYPSGGGLTAYTVSLPGSGQANLGPFDVNGYKGVALGFQVNSMSGTASSGIQIRLGWRNPSMLNSSTAYARMVWAGTPSGGIKPASGSTFYVMIYPLSAPGITSLSSLNSSWTGYLLSVPLPNHWFLNLLNLDSGTSYNLSVDIETIPY